MNYIGVDIGGTKCAVVLGDENGKVLRKIKFPTGGFSATLEKLLAAVSEMGECAAVGISCGGPLDANSGVILSPPNLPGWDEVPIVRLMSERTDAPAYLCNDADACALAEWKFGAGAGCRNMVFLTFGTGLGAGLILNGRLYRGSCGMAGEAGHIRLAEDGPVGYGKNGSFEGFCSGGGIARLGVALAKQALAEGGEVGYCRDESELASVSARSIAEAAHAGDPTAQEVYRISAGKLGTGLSILVDLLNPDRIVIGSIFARDEALFRREMEEVLKKEALAPSLACCEILPAALGDRIGDVAALTVAMEGENLTGNR